MTDSTWSPSMVAPRDPWFRQHPRTALALAAGLYLTVLSLTVYAGPPGDDYFLLYVFPVALITITFGWRAGLTAGLTAVAFVIAWVVLRDVSLTATGWVAHAAPMLVLGLLLGRAADRLRSAEAARLQSEAAALLHREAIEINDLLVQGMAVARWSLQAGQIDAGLKVLDETLSRAQELVSDLIRRADMGSRSEPLDRSGDSHSVWR
ncbi:hypothetical protein [Kribbella shirazensis]|uniref:Histidine kinase n=1 Tax=Kribbella shirazensis TaxID=1105143 RepID=A0A7X6A2N5_9ACTN|nr:hypothetical protein [Kribbella shirazensis]NIK59120.1 hypothetical protein [Kribbella shirazensis]